MKTSLFAGSILLGVAVSAPAQGTLDAENAPPVLVPMTPLPTKRVTIIPLRNVPANVLAYQLDPAHNSEPANWEQIQLARPPIPDAFKSDKSDAPQSITPALEAFANDNRLIEFQLRWLQIEADAVTTALPTWEKLGAGAWSHVASPAELTRLELMKALGVSSQTQQQIYGLNNQTTSLSFSPLLRIEAPTSLDFVPEPLDDMVLPRSQTNPIFDAMPYMPNLARPESKLSEMAPMPGARGQNDAPFSDRLPAPKSAPDPEKRERVSRQLSELMGYKFQLRPTITGDRAFALELKSTNSGDNIAAKATLEPGETAVFSLPNIFMISGTVQKVRRTFVLITPRLMPTPKMPGTTVPKP